MPIRLRRLRRSAELLGALSIAEIEILEKVAQGMPASSAGLCPPSEDEDAAPVGFVR
jgi:hypothetical protein